MASAEEYVEYLDPQYRIHAEEYFKLIEQWHETFSIYGYPLSEEVLEEIDTRGAMRNGGELGACDPLRRLRETEAEGIAAEILHPDGPLSMAPFYNSFYPVVSPELRAAGARAHNRFLGDFCSAAPGRFIGVYLIYPWPDMDAAVAECYAAAAAGGRAIQPPNQAGVENDPSPGLYDPCYDPLWAACQELGLVVEFHAGWGNPQGSLEGQVAIARAAIESGDTTALAEVLDTFVERRPLWQLMWGGVFDRFPRLKVAFVEIHCDWIPGTLAFLDETAKKEPAGKLSPTEYWHRNCAASVSVPRFGDAAVRHDVGIERFMWGSDYPHVESSWPNTKDWIRKLMGEYSEEELRKVLGENAIEFWGLDKELLDAVAFRCGPLPSELLGKGHLVDPLLIDHLDRTGGVRKPARLQKEKTEAAVAEDIRAALLVRPK
jgi:predicted TIM-barrel fold metal-dependent hydrolase